MRDSGFLLPSVTFGLVITQYVLDEFTMRLIFVSYRLIQFKRFEEDRNYGSWQSRSFAENAAERELTLNFT